MTFTRHGNGGGGTRGAGESTILKRRQREEHLATYTESVKGFQKMNSRAEWEHTLHVKSETNQVHRTLNQLKSKQENLLQQRRIRLAELFNQEMENWKNQCLANLETPEDRKQKMIQRALELKERRERERRQLVEEKLLQQYRESCDDVRLVDSNRLQEAVLTDREHQILEKNQLHQKDKQFEQQMVALWEEDRLKKEQRERLDKEMAIKRNEEVKNILDLQVDLYQKRVFEEEKQKKQEDFHLLEEWKMLRELEEEKEFKKKENDILRAFEVKKFNMERMEATKKQQEHEKKYDLKLLELALEQEKEAEKREKEIQEQFKQEQLEYQRMLRKQMEMEAEDLSYLDKIRSEMEHKVWEKRDLQHQLEEKARQELLQQVLQSRQEQLHLKQIQQMEQKKQDLNYMEQIKKETQEALQKEIDEQEAKKNEMKRNQHEILRQKEEKQMELEQKQQAEFLELKRMQLMEKKHQEKVKQLTTQQGNVPLPNYRRKTSQWYD